MFVTYELLVAASLAPPSFCNPDRNYVLAKSLKNQVGRGRWGLVGILGRFYEPEGLEFEYLGARLSKETIPRLYLVSSRKRSCSTPDAGARGPPSPDLAATAMLSSRSG
jgi:hypothetical protein